MQILKGKLPGAIRAVIYGTEGIGKTTLASKIPGSLVLDTEDGSKQLDIDRALCLDWRAVQFAVKELQANAQGYKAIIIDSADWLEKALIEHMLKTSGKKSIEEFGYGKGYTILQENFNRFLAECDKLIAAGIHVIFVAHSLVKRVSPPDQTDGYDRYELKLTKQVAPALKEWADLILFCTYRMQLIEGTDGRIKATGTNERIMHAERAEAWDAKNRFSLPAEMPMKIEEILHVFTGAAPRHVAPAPVVTPATETKPTDAPAAPESTEPIIYLASEEQTTSIATLASLLGQAGSQITDKALEAADAVGCDELSEAQADELIKALRDAGEKSTSRATDGTSGVINGAGLKINMPPAIIAWLDKNEEKANAYLVSLKWIKPGSTWRDLKQVNADSIADRQERFARAAKIAMPGGAT